MPLPSPDIDARAGTERTEVRRARALLGTIVDIRAAALGPIDPIDAAVDAAFAAVERVQQLMSYHDPQSDVSRLNRQGAQQAQQVDAHTYRVLETSLHFARLSDGAFDPCIAAHLEDWGYLPRAQDRVVGASWRDIQLMTHRRVKLRRPLLDLGGIAKGYAVDLAVQRLQAARIEEIVVNAGGDLRVAGTRKQCVQLRHPSALTPDAHRVELRDAAIATSAAYYSRRRRAGREVSTLVDPYTREPYVGGDSISVQAQDCMSADALTKLVLFASPALAQRALEDCDAHAIVLRQHPPLACGR